MSQSRLLVRPTSSASDGRVIHVTPQNAGWQYVGFDLYRLPPGALVTGGEAGREVCLVFVSGNLIGTDHAIHLHWLGHTLKFVLAIFL